MILIREMIVLTNEQVRNLGEGGNTCLDSPARKADLHKPAGLYPCHRQGGNQVQIDARTMNPNLDQTYDEPRFQPFVSLSTSRVSSCRSFSLEAKIRLFRICAVQQWTSNALLWIKKQIILKCN